MNIINTTLSQTKDCSSIQLYDTTGTYSSTNTGGYGTPNLDISHIQYAILQLSEYPNDYTDILLNQASAQSIAGGTVYNITNTVLAQGQSDFIPDVYATNYIVFFLNPALTNITFTFTSGSNLVTYVNSGTDPLLSGISYFQINGDSTIYQIASFSGSTSVGTLTLTIPFGSNTTVTGNHFYNGYSKTNYIAATCTIQNCVASQIAYPSDDCDCENEAFNALAMLFSIQSNMAVNNYTKAQEVIKWLSDYCDEGDCGCH